MPSPFLPESPWLHACGSPLLKADTIFQNISRLIADIEDISRKTGNFKRFPVFVKMLVSALEQSSDAVFLDLLTYADLVSMPLHYVR